MLSSKEIFNIFEEKRKNNIIDKDELCLYNLNLSKPKLYERIKNSKYCDYIVSVYCMCDNCKMLSQLFDLSNYKLGKELICSGRKFMIEKYDNLESFYVNINAHYIFDNNIFVYGFVCRKYGYIIKEIYDQKINIDPRASELKKKIKIENILPKIKAICLNYKDKKFFNNDINSKCYKDNKIIFDYYYNPKYISYYNTPLLTTRAYLKDNNILFNKFISFEPEDFGYFFINYGYIINFYMLIISLLPHIDKHSDKFLNLLSFIFIEEDKEKVNNLLSLEDNYFQSTKNIISSVSNMYLNIDILDFI